MHEAEQAVADERARTEARIAALTADVESVVTSIEGVGNDDEHDPDGSGGIAFERAQLLALLAAARSRLAELDGAVERMAGDRYGRCTRCGEPIHPERLAALPTTESCVACASSRSGVIGTG